MENNKTALLVMDMQMGILPRLPQQGAEIVKNIAGAINAAREKDILIIFVRVGFRKGLPDIGIVGFAVVCNHFSFPIIGRELCKSPHYQRINHCK